MPQIQSVVPERPRAFDLLEANTAAPAVRPATVMRPGLVNRLRASRMRRLVTIVAPAGYGKTTLLAQWAERDERPFAWVTIEEGEDAPPVLLRYVAAALNRAHPVRDSVIDAVAAASARGWSRALARLAGALARLPKPIVLVVDDAHLVRSPDAARLIATLVRHAPKGSTVALAGRAVPDLGVARLRAAGLLLELGPDELAFNRREAGLLLRAAQVQLDEAEVAELNDRTEGWAAGLHLAGLALQDGACERRPAGQFSGDDRFVVDYFRFEHLSRLSPSELRFLTRTAILDSMSGPLCDAVLQRKRSTSARELEALERASLFVVPLDRRRVSYRYHRLFRDVLRAELARREPELVPELNRRAAAWCEANGAPEAAKRYAAAAGDQDLVARLVADHALPAYFQGRVVEPAGWLEGIDEEQLLARGAATAVVASWICALAGRPDQGDRCLQAAERGLQGDESLAPLLALLRAAYCQDGVDEMLAGVHGALEELAGESPWRPVALLLCGVGHLLLGDDDQADASLAEAASSCDAVELRRLALAERSLVAMRAGDHTRASGLLREAHVLGDEGRRRGAVTAALALAASARAELRAGRWDAARSLLGDAQRLTPWLSRALPWYAVQTHLELARAQMALLDTRGASKSLSRAAAIVELRPALGLLPTELEAVRAELDGMRADDGHRRTKLTAAELRLIPLLTTHLSFREIGERLHVSQNTIKTQAISVYRKLGVSSRTEAINRAVALGLVRSEEALGAGLQTAAA